MIEKGYEKVMLLRYAYHLPFFREKRKIPYMVNLLTLNEDYYISSVDNFISVVMSLSQVQIIRPSDNSVLAVLDYSEIYRSTNDFIVRPVNPPSVIILAMLPF
jgi:hypothetical protein